MGLGTVQDCAHHYPWAWTPLLDGCWLKARSVNSERIERSGRSCPRNWKNGSVCGQNPNQLHQEFYRRYGPLKDCVFLEKFKQCCNCLERFKHRIASLLLKITSMKGPVHAVYLCPFCGYSLPPKPTQTNEPDDNEILNAPCSPPVSRTLPTHLRSTHRVRSMLGT